VPLALERLQADPYAEDDFSPDDPTSLYLYRLPLDGSGRLERITPEDLEGNHRYQMSKNTRWAIHTGSAFGSPPFIDLVEISGHDRVRLKCKLFRILC
jgi:dipeptidyl-peptidase-4